jgi:hypothetical protein
MKTYMLHCVAFAFALAAGTTYAKAMPKDAPAGTTGKCADGTYTDAATKSGACSSHKGVKEWYAKAPSHPKGKTGMCEDGTYTDATSKQGACSSHGGVKDWYAK